MNIRDIKPWEWLVAGLLMLTVIVAAVLLLRYGTTLQLLPMGSKVYYMVFCVLYAVVLLWALYGMYRMACWQGRASGLLGAFWFVVAADELCNLVQTALILFTKLGVNGLDVFTALFSVMEMLTWLFGIVVVVRLFHDGVKPLSIILVAFVVLPIAVGLLLPPIEMLSAVSVLSMLVMTAVVALMFLFRKAPGTVDDND